jgi:hypothetical protein
MAHGNLSDMVFLALLVVVVQWFAFPDTLFQEIGPFKAQFASKSADMDAIIKFGGGLLLMIGLTFSGVSWNPINGKMAGFGGFVAAGYTAFSTFKADSDLFVPRLFYAYAFVLFVGAVHIFFLPSNAVPPKTPETKSNHGNFSDFVALGLIITSLVSLFYPEHLFQDLGPLKAQFTTKSPDLFAMIKFVSCLMLMIGLTLSGVKWNPINGKMAGIGGFVAAGYTAFSTLQAYIYTAGHLVFVPRLFYIYAALIFLGALHIFAFPSNPLVAKPKKN